MWDSQRMQNNIKYYWKIILILIVKLEKRVINTLIFYRVNLRVVSAKNFGKTRSKIFYWR